MPRVLFVSKPVAPPFHDGTKCLVRDVSSALRHHDAVVMGTAASRLSSAFPAHVQVAAVYADSGAFSPALAANARAAAWLATRARADLWHFVFAPNPKTGAVARLTLALRRVPSLQTVASPPQRFDHRDFFGDIVIAQSEWTRRRIEQAFDGAGRPAPRLEVIPPPVGPVSEPRESDVARVRAELRLSSDRPVFVYPGDLEVGRGAERVGAAVPFLASLVPGAIVVFACRHKTTGAPAIEAQLRARLDPESVRFAREVHLAALLRASAAVLFPVDDLRGKVDLPISLLEAMRLGVPVVTVREGPLADLEGTLRVELEDPRGLAEAAAALARGRDGQGGGDVRETTISRALAEVARKYDSGVIAAAYERQYDSLLRSR